VVTDHEAVVVELAAFIATKPQHGRADLLTKIAELQDAHRVPAGELSRLLRLYGVEVERARSMVAQDESRFEAERIAAGIPSVGVGGLAGHHRPGGHDGNADGSSSG
jgi:methylmalonyl-CoA mutase cobalamin-binding subunit